MSESDLAARLEGLSGAIFPAYVLYAAVDLGVFEQLRAPCTVPELAQRSRATVDGTLRLVRALAALDLVRLEGGVVAAAPGALELLGAGARSIAPVLRHHRHQLAPLLARLPAALRGEGSQLAAWEFARSPPAESAYLELARHPEQLEDFLLAMDHASRGVGADLAARVELREVRRMVDLGCGGGVVARELLAACPELRIESFDLAEAAERARDASTRAGLEARHVVRAGDLLSGVAARDADAALLSAVLADWGPAERARILATALEVLAPGGLLVVSETLLDDDALGPPKAAMFSLLMLLAMRGDQLGAAQLSRELLAAGFEAPTVLRGGPRDVVLARKPR